MNNKHFDERLKLGLNIQYYRKLNDYTQDRLAEAIDVSREHLSNIERAVSSASVDVLFSIAEVLHVSINKFFEFRD